MWSIFETILQWASEFDLVHLDNIICSVGNLNDKDIIYIQKQQGSLAYTVPYLFTKESLDLRLVWKLTRVWIEIKIILPYIIVCVKSPSDTTFIKRHSPRVCVNSVIILYPCNRFDCRTRSGSCCGDVSISARPSSATRIYQCFCWAWTPNKRIGKINSGKTFSTTGL